MTLYITGATVVFGLLLRAFLKDASTSKTNRLSWLVIVVATAFWPVVLPSIIRKRFAKPASVAVPLKTQLS